MKHDYLYGGLPASAESAAGTKGVLLRTVDGTILFRVYREAHKFNDYEIGHDELTVTIDADELVAFYKIGERHVLDHSPEVLGLRGLKMDSGFGLALEARLARRRRAPSSGQRNAPSPRVLPAQPHQA